MFKSGVDGILNLVITNYDACEFMTELNENSTFIT